MSILIKTHEGSLSRLRGLSISQSSLSFAFRWLSSLFLSISFALNWNWNCFFFPSWQSPYRRRCFSGSVESFRFCAHSGLVDIITYKVITFRFHSNDDGTDCDRDRAAMAVSRFHQFGNDGITARRFPAREASTTLVHLAGLPLQKREKKESHRRLGRLIRQPFGDPSHVESHRLFLGIAGCAAGFRQCLRITPRRSRQMESPGSSIAHQFHLRSAAGSARRRPGPGLPHSGHLSFVPIAAVQPGRGRSARSSAPRASEIAQGQRRRVDAADHQRRAAAAVVLVRRWRHRWRHSRQGRTHFTCRLQEEKAQFQQPAALLPHQVTSIRNHMFRNNNNNE